VVQVACALYDRAELAALVRIELGSLGVHEIVVADAEPAAAALATDLAVLRVACADAPNVVTVQVADFASGKALEREVVVSSVEEKARPRLLAMTAAGLLESSWLELAVDPSRGRIALPEAIRKALRRKVDDALFPTRPQTREAPAPIAAPPQPAAASTGRSSFQLTGIAQSFPARSTGLAGVGIGYAYGLGTNLRGWVDVDAQLGAYEVSDGSRRVGSMQLRWLTGGLGVAWTSTTTPRLAVGPFVRAGLAAAEIDTTDGSTAVADARGAVGILGLRGELEAPLSSLLSAFVALEGGYLPLGVVFVAAGQRPAGMAEMMLAARIGLSLTP
jgi:hypothetical protein